MHLHSQFHLSSHIVHVEEQQRESLEYFLSELRRSLILFTVTLLLFIYLDQLFVHIVHELKDGSRIAKTHRLLLLFLDHLSTLLRILVRMLLATFIVILVFLYLVDHPLIELEVKREHLLTVIYHFVEFVKH